MNEATSLLGLATGETAVVCGCNGHHGLMCRLAAMGFTPGSRITVVSNHRHGPILVAVHGSRVALGRGEAAKVLVRPDGHGSGG